MNTKRGFAPILIVVILGLIAVTGYLVFKPTLSTLQPTPTTTPEDQTADWKEYSSDSCGAVNPKTMFSISIPSNWNSSLQEDEIWAKHTLSSAKGEKFTILCGIGFGGGCEDKKEIRLGNETKLACYSEDEKGVRISQIGAESNNGIGVSIEADFPNNEESKETLNQILSTFKFTY